jgi:hypothetical protein
MFARAILAPRAAGRIARRRRSRVALAVLGVTLAVSSLPATTIGSHGGPHPEIYLGQLHEDFAVEHREDLTPAAPMADTILAGYQQRLAIEYPTDSAAGAVEALLEGRQRQLVIEYPRRAQATHYGPPGR